jgi:hypothetical protein
MTLLDTLSPEDQALITSCMPHYMTAKDGPEYAKPLKVWHVCYLPHNGNVTDEHVISLLSSLATESEKKFYRLEIESHRRTLNTWALDRLKNMFVQLTRRNNLRVKGKEVCDYASAKQALGEAFQKDNACKAVDEVQINWWVRNKMYLEILEEEYMRYHNIVYRIMTAEEIGKIRRKCIAKHIRQKYTDCVREIKASCKKTSNGKYLVSTLRGSKAMKKSIPMTGKHRESFLACDHDTASTSFRQQEFVCGGNCQVSKDLREKLAVEIQNHHDSETQYDTKIEVSIT